MKRFTTLFALCVVAGLTLVGCGSSSSDQQSKPAPAQQTATPDIKAGVQKMIATSTDLKAAIDAGDEAKAKTVGPQLEDEWSSFEDAVKSKYPDLYEEVEKSLDPTIAGSKATPLDKAVVGKTNDELMASLNKLAQKAQ
ncbi:MAG: hypothetical protein ACXVP5_12845 [Tumebacillaceae bacterium]